MGPNSPVGSFVRTASTETNVAEELPPAAEVMSEQQWYAELDKLGSV